MDLHVSNLAQTNAGVRQAPNQLQAALEEQLRSLRIAGPSQDQREVGGVLNVVKVDAWILVVQQFGIVHLVASACLGMTSRLSVV